MDGTKSLSELLAYVLVAAMAGAMLLPFLLPVFRRWARLFRASRWRGALSTALLLAFVYIGGSLEKRQGGGPFTPEAFFGGGQPSLRTGDSPSLPQWYVDLGYPVTDSDGDGIPDYWERRTRTNPAVADASADPDGDGVDNAEEFLHQCDPVVADTDGDGLTDREEIDGQTAGWAGFHPVCPALYDADESDAGAWSNDTDIVVFSGTSSAGYPWGVDFPDESATNVDVLVTVDSSRHAELSWNDGDDWPSRLLLPPCTNLALRILVPADESTTVTLSPAAGATGLWRAALRAEWDERRGLDIERNRVRAGNGAMVDIGNEPAVFAGVLPGTFAVTNPASLRGGALTGRQISRNRRSPFLEMTVRWGGDITMSASCVHHGPNPTFEAGFINPVPPFRWVVNDQEFTTETPVLNLPFTAEMYRVCCFDSGGYELLPLGTGKEFRPGYCENGSPTTNIVGAGWTSTHNPTNAADHVPGVKAEVLSSQYGPMCPVYTNTIVRVGWTHNEAILWLRNLVRKLTGHPEDDETDHCINVLWSEGGTINLWSFLDPVCLPYTNSLSIRVWENGVISGPELGTIVFGEEPEYVIPDVYNIVLCNRDGSVVYDRMWLVISSPEDKTSFDDWYDRFSTNLLWTASLPRPPTFLLLSTNSSETVTASTPAPYTSQWSSPHVFSSHDYMHHTAAYELRTEISAQHGNQATYDELGIIITHSIAAGSADWFGPYGPLGTPDDARSHRNFDVYPYLRALQLDGNPGLPRPRRWKPKTLAHPCLRQGDNLNRYLFCRPCIY